MHRREGCDEGGLGEILPGGAVLGRKAAEGVLFGHLQAAAYIPNALYIADSFQIQRPIGYSTCNRTI